MEKDPQYDFSAFDGRRKKNFSLASDYFDHLPIQIMVKREVAQFKRNYWMGTAIAAGLLLFSLLYLPVSSNSSPISYGESQAANEAFLNDELTDEEVIELYLSTMDPIN